MLMAAVCSPGLFYFSTLPNHTSCHRDACCFDTIAPAVWYLCVHTGPSWLATPTRLRSPRRSWAPQRARQPLRQPHRTQHACGLGCTQQWGDRQCTVQHDCPVCGMHWGSVQPAGKCCCYQPYHGRGQECKHTGRVWLLCSGKGACAPDRCSDASCKTDRRRLVWLHACVCQVPKVSSFMADQSVQH